MIFFPFMICYQDHSPALIQKGRYYPMFKNPSLKGFVLRESSYHERAVLHFSRENAGKLSEKNEREVVFYELWRGSISFRIYDVGNSTESRYLLYYDLPKQRRLRNFKIASHFPCTIDFPFSKRFRSLSTTMCILNWGKSNIHHIDEINP